jgi:hypothetical protein
VSRRSRRHVRVPPDLTSLFDVLFIVIFAALIRAAAVEQAAAQAATPKPKQPSPPPVQLATAQLHTAALADLGTQLAARPYVVVRIANGAITALEIGDKITKLDTPLLEHSPDPDIGIAYLGDRAAELRICKVIAGQFAAADLAGYLVILAPDQHLPDLPHALYEGLRRDIDRCLADQQALAVLVDPSVETKPSGETKP